MSRRRGEFEHRTSIFEGAFRAWSHLGGLEPSDLETKVSERERNELCACVRHVRVYLLTNAAAHTAAAAQPASELDPLACPILNDPRLAAQKEKDRRKANSNNSSKQTDGTVGVDNDNDFSNEASSSSVANKTPTGREYPYEPLPRSGLVHPFVQAILSPWLGPDADQDAIQLGLTTLRTWWQHRRKGESGSAIVALGTDKMQGVVDGYTRHFFNLAHCLVVNDGEQPPRTLQGKMREAEKSRLASGNGKKRKRGGSSVGGGGQDGNAATAATTTSTATTANAMQMNAAYGRQQQQQQPLLNMNDTHHPPLLDRLHASQRRLLAAEGGVSTFLPGGHNNNNNNAAPIINNNTYPMLELKGRCTPNKIDLPGLVRKVNSAATQLAHRGFLSNTHAASSTSSPSVIADPSKYGDPNLTPLLLISSSNDVQFLMTLDGITCAHCVKIIETVLKGAPGRISSSGSPIEGLLDVAADRELNAIVVKIDGISEARRIAYESARNLSMVGYTAVARSVNITEMGNGNGGEEDSMTLQTMGRVFEIIPKVNPMMGNVLDWSLECSCPVNDVSRVNCPRHQQMSNHIFESFDKAQKLVSDLAAGCGKKYGMPCTAGNHCFCKSDNVEEVSRLNDMPDTTSQANLIGAEDTQPILRDGTGRSGRMSMRMSLGGLLGRHSLTSHTTFGRAMSGLSALSIDWENMEDFDINVDHSEGINNDIVNRQKEEQQQGGEDGEEAAVDDRLNGGESQQQDSEESFGSVQRVGPGTARRSSLRNPMTNNGAVNANMNVSFDM